WTKRPCSTSAGRIALRSLTLSPDCLSSLSEAKDLPPPQFPTASGHTWPRTHTADWRTTNGLYREARNLFKGEVRVPKPGRCPLTADGPSSASRVGHAG